MTQNIEVLTKCVSEYNLSLEYSLYCDTKEFEGQMTKLYGICVNCTNTKTNEEETAKVDDITSKLPIAKELLEQLKNGLVTPVTLLDCIYEFVDNLYSVK